MSTQEDEVVAGGYLLPNLIHLKIAFSEGLNVSTECQQHKDTTMVCD
jgi:hypothetical protein